MTTPTDLIRIISDYSAPKTYYGYNIDGLIENVYIYDSFDNAMKKLVCVGRGEISELKFINPTIQQFNIYRSHWHINDLIKKHVILDRWDNYINVNDKYYVAALQYLKKIDGFNNLVINKGCVWN